jgi:predicted nuclease with RNAse H fold
MFPSVPIVGIDCATLHGNTGLCFGTWDGSELHVTRARVCTHKEDLVESVTKELAGATRAVMALDAPLGWPVPLADGLREHRAGQPLSGQRHELFRRTTDRLIEDWSGKRPLEVGANLIARTAHAALTELDAIRKALKLEIELAWSPGPPDGIVAIEVYPAVTWIAHERRWPDWFPVSDPNQYDHPLHVRDAVLCAVAAVDFLQGRAVAPRDDERTMAEREGWIWAWKDRLIELRARGK